MVHQKEDIVRKLSIVAVVLLSAALSTQAFGQSTYATVSGTVADLSGAVLPGVSLTQPITRPELLRRSSITGTAATNFGVISGKNIQHRELQAQLRFNF